jgi:hypothetical protein
MQQHYPPSASGAALHAAHRLLHLQQGGALPLQCRMTCASKVCVMMSSDGGGGEFLIVIFGWA